MARLRTALIIIVVLLVGSSAFAQVTPAPSREQIMETIAPSVVLVLAGDTAGEATTVASGVIVRPYGVLLAIGHGIKDAKKLQVRLKSGDVYDQVQLMGYDERRDVAALRILASELPALTVVSSAQVKAGTPLYLVSNGTALRWTASAGTLNATRLAEDVAGAGSGYRLLQFTAPIAPASSGGVVVDAQGRALGIVIAGLLEGRNVQFAVPLDAVMGLAALPGGTTYASGADLTMPKPEPLPPELAAQPEASGEDPNLPSETRDPQAILRTFRFLYINSQTSWLKPIAMKNVLYKRPELSQWGIAVVEQPNAADVVLRIDREGTEDYSYELLHQKTSIVLISGRVTGLHLVPWKSGNAAAPKIADKLVSDISAAGRALPPDQNKKKGKRD